MGLYKPAWLNEDEEKSLQLVKRLDDEDTLFRIAKEAKHFIVKEAAVKKLIHLGHLIDIAMNDKNEYFRKTAIELLQTKFQNYNGAASAVETLTNQKILADFAINSIDNGIRIAAIKNLTDQSILLEVAENDSFAGVRIRAAAKLTDEVNAKKIFIDIAKNEKSKYDRHAAIYHLTDREILADIAKNDEDAFIRKFAEEKIGKLDCQGDGVHNWQYKGRLEERNNEDFSFCYDVYYCTKCGKEIKKDKNSF